MKTFIDREREELKMKMKKRGEAECFVVDDKVGLFLIVRASHFHKCAYCHAALALIVASSHWLISGA
jgi:hypothetical protein